MTASELDTLCINTIRTLSIDAVQKANSGHPGLPMGAAPMAYALWQKHLKHNPRDPKWPDRDRFVLSPGHGSMLLYSLLHLTGYELSMDDIKEFRQWGKPTAGHPESFLHAGIEATTGPLGQGSANAVGMAMAERALAHRFNRPGHDIVDHFTFALVSDGDLMEGVAAEAAALAGHLKLGKLIYLYDANDVTLDGPADLCFTEDICKRYEAHGWQVLRVEDGDTDVDAIDKAIAEAKADTERPSIIYVHTTIGYGSPNKGGTCKSHGSPLGPDEIALTKKALGWDPEAQFLVPDTAQENFRSAVGRGETWQAEWNDKLSAYGKEHPELHAQWLDAVAGKLPEGWDSDLPNFAAGESIATRSAAGKVQNAIAAKVPGLIGGDADLGGSTKTVIADGGSYEGQGGSGRNIHFGVREHAMGSICNGIDYHGGGLRPFAATFFCFSDYMRPAVRIAALNGQAVTYVWTHDSIFLGEDGPTHQPVEHLMSLRAMPNLYMIRPGDANEAREAWQMAMQRTEGPTALVLTRQNVPVIADREEGGVLQGGYVVRSGGDAPQAIIIATGSELHLAVEAAETLAGQGTQVRVVSLPCWERFLEQDQAYRDSVLPPSVSARVSVEAGVTFGWSRWTGDRGVSIGVDKFGASAPAGVLMEKYGITAANVVKTVKEIL